MRRRKLLTLVGSICLVIALVAASLMAACGPAEAPTAEVVKMGTSMALSGPAAQWGTGYTNSHIIAAKKINADGGFTVGGKNYIWEVVAYDDKYVVSETVSCVNKLIYQDKVNYIHTLGGSPSITAAPLTTKAGIMQFCNAAASPKFINPDYPLVFQNSPTHALIAQYALYTYMMEKEGIKTIATIQPDDETGYSGAEGCKVAAEKHGLKLVATELFPRGKTEDFYPYLNRIMAKKPDLIDALYVPFESAALIAKQLHELGYKGIYVPAYVDPQRMVEATSPEAMEGVYVYGNLVELVTPKQKECHDAFVAEFGEWNSESLLTYHILFQLTEAMEQADSLDPNKVADVYEDMTIHYCHGDGMFGLESLYGIKRAGLLPVPLAQFKDGAWHHITSCPPEEVN